LLSNGSISPELLLKIMQPNNADFFKAIVREMIENQQIRVDSEGNLSFSFSFFFSLTKNP
jgi:hypothetical protein